MRRGRRWVIAATNLTRKHYSALPSMLVVAHVAAGFFGGCECSRPLTLSSAGPAGAPKERSADASGLRGVDQDHLVDAVAPIAERQKDSGAVDAGLVETRDAVQSDVGTDLGQGTD